MENNSRLTTKNTEHKHANMVEHNLIIVNALAVPVG